MQNKKTKSEGGINEWNLPRTIEYKRLPLKTAFCKSTLGDYTPIPLRFELFLFFFVSPSSSTSCFCVSFFSWDLS